MYYTSLPDRKVNEQTKRLYSVVSTKKKIIPKQNTENLFSAISGIDTSNPILFTTPKTLPLTKNNHHKSNHHYPINTAIKINFHIPYLNNIKLTVPYDAENYYTDNNTPKNRLTTYLSAETNYFLYILQDSIMENIGIQSLSMDQPGFYAQSGSPSVEYFYYRSMNGTCPACVMAGGIFDLSGGITYPNSDGPAQNEQGYPLGGFSTCEALQAAIAAEPYVSGAEIIVGYPILWSITYKDGTTIEGVGCENVPADFADAVAQNSAGLSEEECSDLSEQYPNVNISFNMFDTTLISSTTQPSGALGTPCSDLFAISK